jgi:hypothetical protein
MKTLPLKIGALAFALLAQTAAAQVIVNEQFNYENLAALQAKWSNTNGLTLELGSGNPAPSAGHSGAAVIHGWTGSTFSVTPTAANPLVLSVDIYNSGAGNQRNTVGLRTGANPLFEMGMYNAFDNDPYELENTGNGIGARILNFAGSSALAGQKWVKLDDHYTGWSRWEATFTDLSLTLRIDHGVNGIWDVVYTSTGTNVVGAFTDLRFGGPSGLSSAGGGFAVDNIVLQVIPEPSTYALLGVGAVMFAFFARRKK